MTGGPYTGSTVLLLDECMALPDGADLYRANLGYILRSLKTLPDIAGLSYM